MKAARLSSESTTGMIFLAERVSPDGRCAVDWPVVLGLKCFPDTEMLEKDARQRPPEQFRRQKTSAVSSV